MAVKGKFHPQNPQKYKGNPTNIIFRSSWEFKVMMRFDSDPNIVWWQSEETVIPYISPVDGKRHRYFPDFLIAVKQPSGLIEKVLIEVKPKNQVIEPVKIGQKPSKKYIREVMTYGVNSAKWTAAEAFCKYHGYTFQILTETEIYGKK